MAAQVDRVEIPAGTLLSCSACSYNTLDERYAEAHARSHREVQLESVSADAEPAKSEETSVKPARRRRASKET